MTDEGILGQPMDSIEALQAMRDGAAAFWQMFQSLKEAGFTEPQALTLVAAQMHGVSGGKYGG